MISFFSVSTILKNEIKTELYIFICRLLNIAYEIAAIWMSFSRPKSLILIHSVKFCPQLIAREDGF